MNNPIRFIDPTGNGAESSDWIPSTDKKGNIVLTAEKGDNVNSLIKFLGGNENAKEFVDEAYLNKNISYQEGDKVKLNEDNVFSLTMSYYNENSEDIKKNGTYDCKELCRQLVLNENPIEQSYQGGYSQSGLQEFGEDWSKKREVTQQKFGKTFLICFTFAAIILFINYFTLVLLPLPRLFQISSPKNFIPLFPNSTLWWR